LDVNQPVAGGEQFAAISAPNMLGHLLYGSLSTNFRYNRAAGPINVADNGSTSVVNPAVADDNSPLPQDRVGFRFNYFDNAQHVTGFGPAVPTAPGVQTAFAQVRNFNVEEYTFNFEKTFFSGMASVELRLPFSTGLSQNLHLSAGTVTGPTATDGSFPVTATPDQSLGSDGTSFGNLTLIFKGLTYSSKALSLGGGLALGIPTGDNFSTDIIDYSGGAVTGTALVQRDRNIHIDNETWSLSPFVTALWTPNDRFFMQGFLEFDFPLNESTINYTETALRGGQFIIPVSAFPIRQGNLVANLIYPTQDLPISTKTSISEQSLMQLDWGTGYWLLKDPSRTWLTGFAPTFELHYTSTLTNASVVQLPADTLFQIDPTTGKFAQEQPPRVGNLNNRVDIFDLTFGATFLFTDRAMLATGFSFPLKGSTDRTFDWEFLLQLNYYFGARDIRAANF
jgi:hypothetical protein